MKELTAEEIQVKLVEYEQAQDMLKHYDSLNWQIGSILIGANAVLVGLVVNFLPKAGWWGIAIAVAVSGFSYVLLHSWWMYFERHRSLYNFRNEALHRLEVQLGMYHFLHVAEASRRGQLTPAQEEQDRAARAAAYAGEEFVPLYTDLSLDGKPGHEVAHLLSWLVPLLELAILALAVVAPKL